VVDVAPGYLALPRFWRGPAFHIGGHCRHPAKWVEAALCRVDPRPDSFSFDRHHFEDDTLDGSLAPRQRD
jgi:hypothetical protein